VRYKVMIKEFGLELADSLAVGRRTRVLGFLSLVPLPWLVSRVHVGACFKIVLFSVLCSSLVVKKNKMK